MSQDGVRASGIFDLIKIGFVPLQRAHNIKYLASGAAADIWKVQSLESHNNFPSLYVSKVLRISPSGFKDIPTYVGSANQRSPADSPQVAGNERFSWEAFVNMYTHKVSQWALLRHENIIRVYSNTQSLNLHVDFCLNGTVRDALQTPGGRMMNKWDIVEWD
ncbi:unnamed protein product [Rhizoctonia solani]|uniref:Protein kinase domain-containing protein n=1 Tax=Rhizoctonia solani TaxID=456999 RepID=A0A8H3C1L5_9AGAM|nr:unnamed protein product [Rhizoctonia solani]